jgi:hypothetical protein
VSDKGMGKLVGTAGSAKRCSQFSGPKRKPAGHAALNQDRGFLNRSLSRAHRNKRSSPAFILLLDRRPRAEALTQDARTCDGTCHCVRLGGRGLRSCRSGRHVRREIIKRGNNLRRPWRKKIRNYCPTQWAIYVGGSSLSFVHLLTLAMPSSRHGLRQAIAPLLPAADFRISHPLDAPL